MPKEGTKQKRYWGKRKEKASLRGYTLNSKIPAIKYGEINSYITGKEKNTLPKDEKKKLILGKEAWEASLKFFHNPAIPDPIFVFDKKKFIGFFIELNTWKTILNLANCPHLILDKEILNYYQALSLHEISHYIVCPYDLLTNARLVKAALKHVPERQSPIVVNFFADLLVDMKLYRKKPKIMEEELRQSLKMTQNIGKNKQEKNHSKIFKLLVKCYEIMWNINLNLLQTEYEEITPLADRIRSIIMKDFEDFTTWEKKVKKIAKLLENILKEEFQPPIAKSAPGRGEYLDENNNGESEWGYDLSAGGLDESGKYMSVPLDVQIMAGNPLEIKSKAQNADEEFFKGEEKGRRRSRSDSAEQRDAEILAQEMNLTDFISVNRVMGLVPRTQAIACYYRGISKNLIEIKMLQKKPSGSIPIGIEPWRVGDPIEKLDILQTLLVSPKVIPNITTRKWIMKDGPGIEMELALPDLLLVIDSSGSMEWKPFNSRKKNNSPYHIALVASFAALHYALRKGAKIAAINFSSDFNEQLWTRESRKIEKILLNYQAMGTTLPIKEIKKMVQKAERKSLIILITDFEIFNWKDAFSDIVSILNMGHKMIGFFIGGNSSELKSHEFEELGNSGAKFYPVKKVDDLIGLVIKEVKDTYDI
ncbi:MAG: hypothetical protein ACTSWY_08030 [Promethearchaeota archaeon]